MLPARRESHDRYALDAALAKLGTDRIEDVDRPDAYVTAVRRLPPLAARYTPIPETARRSTQAGAGEPWNRSALLASGRSDRARRAPAGTSSVITPTAFGKTLCAQRAGPQRDPAGRLEPRAVSLSDEGARAGSARRAPVRCARCWRRSRSASSPTTATRRRTRAARSARRAHVVLSNPDMVHSGILPHHPRWAKLFENLRYVVIDELHAYRGVFGSHLANVLRRLRRICRHYGSNPSFICSSRHDREPARARRAPHRAVVRAGRQERRAPRREGVRVREPAGRQSAARHPAVVLGETRRIASEFLKRNLQLDRLRAEPALHGDPHDVSQGRLRRRPRRARRRIRGYRGGYLPNAPRGEIEKRLRDGVVRCVVSTNALELGIDIGALDVAVLARLSGDYRGNVAARGPRRARRTSRSAGGDGGQQRSARSVRRPQPVVISSTRRRSTRSSIPTTLHSRGPRQVRRVRAPFAADERSGGTTSQEILGVLAEQGLVHQPEPGGRWTWTTSRIRRMRSACDR